MTKQRYSATSLPLAPELERRSRMIKYTIAMIIRVICIFAMLFVQGWWLLIFAAGAIFLPYFAVILANAQVVQKRPDAELPSAIILRTEDPS